MTDQKLIFCVVLFFITVNVDAQIPADSLGKQKTQYARNASQTFANTRLINGQTSEITPVGTMDLSISHRFGLFKSGFYNFFGLDEAHMRLGFDFGITNNFMIGVGHNTHIGTYDAFAKLKLLKQSADKNRPLSLTFLMGGTVNARKRSDLEAIMFTPAKAYYVNEFSDRVSFVFQLFMARKFSDNFSLQLVPTLIHHDNIFLNDREEISVYKKVNAFSLGIGARQRLSKKWSLTGEYYYQFESMKNEGSTNSLSVGVDLETGGHIFQMHITNSRHMIEQSFITHTTGKWGEGEILFGFNLHRKFNISRNKKNSW